MNKYVIILKNAPHYKGTDHWLGKGMKKVCNIEDAVTFDTKKQATKILMRIPKKISEQKGFLPPEIEPIGGCVKGEGE
jgi:hypothetical protein